VVVAAGWMELVFSIVDTVAMFAVEVTLAVFTTTVLEKIGDGAVGDS